MVAKRLINIYNLYKEFCIASRVGSVDIVLNIFCLPGNRVIHMAVRDFVQLQDIVSGNRNSVKTLVNDI